MTPPLAAAPQRRAYDHRLREQVCRTGSHALSRRLEIPRSTIATWKRRGLRPVVSVEMFGADRHQLLRTIEKLEKRAQILAATIRLLLALMRASGFRLAHQRLPEGAVKASILRAITSATNALPLAVILRILGLPGSRYHAWRRADTVCGLDDRSSCPRILVLFFVDAHNSQMPHAAFRGQTPDEMYFGTAPDRTADLADARMKARERRLATNRGASCTRCTMPPEPSVGSEIPP